MKYAILRLQKLKTQQSIAGSMRHAYRTQDTPNANPEMTSHNQYAMADNFDAAMSRYKDRLSSVGKIRKNAVMAIEFLVTSSPEHMAKMTKSQQNDYFKKALNWIKSQYGSENVICAGVHRDELTPHMWCHVIPIHQGKLNARHFIGGHKNRLAELQTDFHQKVAEQFGMERGIQGSKSHHTSVRHWYTVMREALNLSTTTTADKIKLILTGKMTEAISGAAALAADARQRSERATKALRIAQDKLSAISAISAEVESTKELLAASEAIIRAQKAQIAAMKDERREFMGLKDLVDRNLDLLRAAESERFGIKLEPLEQATKPVINPAPAALPSSASQLKL